MQFSLGEGGQKICLTRQTAPTLGPAVSMRGDIWPLAGVGIHPMNAGGAESPMREPPFNTSPAILQFAARSGWSQKKRTISSLASGP